MRNLASAKQKNVIDGSWEENHLVTAVYQKRRLVLSKASIVNPANAKTRDTMQIFSISQSSMRLVKNLL